MKRATILLGALLAFPAVAALPGACADPCEIEATSSAYAPPVVIVESGGSVAWRSTDITHVTRDSGVGMGVACFMVFHDAKERSPAVRFDFAEGALFATVEGVTKRCTNAAGHGAAAFELPYFCVIHPTMRGAIVVTAS